MKNINVLSNIITENQISNILSSTYLVKLDRLACIDIQNNINHFAENDSNHYTIHAVCSGEGVFSINNNDYLIKPNDILIVHPSENHRSLTRRTDFNIIWLELDFTLNTELYSIFRTANIHHLINCPEVITYIKNIYDYINSQNKISEYVLSAKCYQMLMCLFEIINNRHFDKKPSLFVCVEQYIKENYCNNISTKDICSFINLSESYFRKIFKEYYHISPSEYIMNKKISKAIYYLKNCDMSCDEIATKLGFFDASHMNRVLKKKINLTPLQIKNLS